MFADAEVSSILCARGGYGSQAIVPLLDVDVIRNSPKPIIGCSDLTALQLWLLDQCGLVSLHGPMAAGDFSRDDGVDLDSWNACTQGTEHWSLGESSGLRTLHEGFASGRLWGGCLSLLVSTLATPLELLVADKQETILFVEDVSEKPYKIERMLTQWRDAGKLQSVTGIVFGEMLGCEQPDVRYTLVDVLRRVLKDFAGPVAYGLRSGHVSCDNVTLPLGVRAELACGVEATLTFREAAMVTA
jgi:muramoyltetrapeptide carboxypeptidase